jgi:hypothetical protein
MSPIRVMFGAAAVLAGLSVAAQMGATRRSDRPTLPPGPAAAAAGPDLAETRTR